MNISLNWLVDYIDINMDVEEVCRILTDIGLEVAGYTKTESIKGGLRGLVIGEVLTCKEHPNSDHLHITEVKLGDEEIVPIVCGAPNVAAGQKVVVATVGTTLYDGDEEFTIKKSKMRGEPSYGMICAEDEIGVGSSHEGIIVLPNDAKVGMPASEYYNITTDYNIEIDITPNRVDGTYHLGVARDLAAYLKQTREIDYHLPSIEGFEIDSTTSDMQIEIENKETCRRYSGICIEGIEIKESPEWLKTKLLSIGLNPINNIVDITNFILFELGQPLHSFDMDKIEGHKVIVKTMDKGSKFVTLDGIERELHEDDLMICNTKEAMCLAGVFGGLKSGISKDTKNVFIESACFDPVYVRKTARRHGLNTDASFRFERGTDPNMTVFALKRAAMLIKELAGGKITSNILDLYPEPVLDHEIKVKFSHIDRLIGKKIGNDKIKNILKSLEIKIVNEDGDDMTLQVPPYRVDVLREADIVEDILRIYGFGNIELPEKVNATLSYSEKPDGFKLRNVISDLLSSKGFNEIINNSLTKASYFEKFDTYNTDETVVIYNPLSSDLNAMRQTLLFGGLESIAYNVNRKASNILFYEFGKAYFFNHKENEDHQKRYEERELLSLFVSGNKNSNSWNTKAEPSNYFYLKGYCNIILERLGFDMNSLKEEESQKDIFKEGMTYSQGKTELLSLGVISNKVSHMLGVDQTVYYAEFNWKNIMSKIKNNSITYTPVSKYPEVKRDLALLLDKNVTFTQVRDIALRTEKKLLKKVSLFDVFENEKLGLNKKSYAVNFTLLDENKTLTDKQIDKIMNKLIGSYKHLLNAEIR